jgi:protein-arginine kinase activator protein McsA
MHDTFIERAQAKHGDRYDYSSSVYTKSNSAVEIICRIHGPFHQIAKVHLKGHGCPKCGGRFVNEENFFNKARVKHGDIYDYSETKFTGANDRVKIITDHLNKSPATTFEALGARRVEFTECQQVNGLMRKSL